MSDRVVPPPMDDLEARLADLATALAFPQTPDLASAIAARLQAAPSLPLLRPLPRPSAWRPQPIRRSLRRSLLLAAALALVIVGGAVAVRIGLDLLSIRFGPVPTLAPSPSAGSPAPAPGTSLGLGREVPLAEARTAAAFDILVPAGLGEPEAVYLGGAGLRGQVAFVYLPRDDLPASRLLSGAGLLITQNKGSADDGLAQKLLDSELATVTMVAVNGAPGVWISGQPHVFWYFASDGTFLEDSRRVVGDTLAWERDGILYRIEGAITLEHALEIARSMA